MTVPVTPKSVLAFSRPVFASALNPRSLSPPMSVTRQIFFAVLVAPPPLVPPQATSAGTSVRASVDNASRRVRFRSMNPLFCHLWQHHAPAMDHPVWSRYQRRIVRTHYSKVAVVTQDPMDLCSACRCP